MHSPFVYHFITKCLYSKISKTALDKLQDARKPILKSDDIIQMIDIGEGSQHFKTSKRRVKTIAKNAGMRLHQSQLMNKIIDYFEVKNTLELGTSVGLGSLSMAVNQPQNCVDTVEACPNTFAFAKSCFNTYGLKNIKTHNTDFQSYINNLSAYKTYDLIYLDGHHQKKATLDYFSQLKKHTHHNSIVILDDIYWSKEMQEAWQLICKDKEVKVSLDLYFWGIVFFKPELSKQDFKIRCLF
ncbi:O-methyltransferase [Flavobacterium sp. CS20]|uniref:O-methyltransferase n=1 Tax=Flavobacterium sp. CS20 TaxID=2775246 RepID=UPI001B3A02C3|nr:class I SAM-dependent methyltransferase [Flavobacterium sp. CS20]QTY26748.1 class I SAM-dependent methyltransferase [Flavobacterium sp. CS20]